MTQEMFCLQGMKLAEKPKGRLGCSGISNYTGSLASKMLFSSSSAKTCAVQGKHLSLLQLTYLTQRSLLASALDHDKAQQGRLVLWHQVTCLCFLEVPSEAIGTSKDTALGPVCGSAATSTSKDAGAKVSDV